jgi:hypothetical protein
MPGYGRAVDRERPRLGVRRICGKGQDAELLVREKRSSAFCIIAECVVLL